MKLNTELRFRMQREVSRVANMPDVDLEVPMDITDDMAERVFAGYVILPKALVERVRAARIELCRIKADFDSFDGDRRGIAQHLYEAEQELLAAVDALTAAMEKNDG